MNSMERWKIKRKREGYRPGRGRSSRSFHCLTLRPVGIEFLHHLAQRTAAVETLAIAVVMTDPKLRETPTEVAVAGVEVREPQALHDEPQALHLADPAPHDRLIAPLGLAELGTRRHQGLEQLARGLQLLVRCARDPPHEREQRLGLRQ